MAWKFNPISGNLDYYETGSGPAPAPSPWLSVNGPVTINNNQIAPATLATLVAADNKYCVIDYSIARSGSYRVGRLLVTHDGSSVQISDDYTEIGTTEVILSCVISGANLLIQYASSDNGMSGTFKYVLKSWN